MAEAKRGVNMDTNQITQMLNWLDEERRRDRKVIEELQQRVEAQSQELEDSQRHVKEIEGRMANLRSQLVEQSQYEEAQQALHKEISLQLERFDNQVVQRLQDVQSLYRNYQDNTGRMINELRKGVDQVSALQEAMSLRKAEEERLATLVTKLKQDMEQLNKDFSDKGRTLTYLAEQRRQDHQRAVRLQEENVEIFSRLEEMRGKLSGVELRVTRQEAVSNAMKALENELRQQNAKFRDEYQAYRGQRQKIEASWEENFAKMTAKFNEYAQQSQEMQIATQLAQNAIDEIQRWHEQLQRDQDRVSELQRLAEERMKQAFEENQSEIRKRLQRQDLQQQQFENEQERFVGQLGERVHQLDVQMTLHADLMRQIWKLRERIMEQRMSAAQAEADATNEALSKRLEMEKKAGN